VGLHVVPLILVQSHLDDPDHTARHQRAAQLRQNRGNIREQVVGAYHDNGVDPGVGQGIHIVDELDLAVAGEVATENASQ